MMISGERTEQLDIFCRVTGFTSDFLSFVDVELIWFFYGALQLITSILTYWPANKMLNNDSSNISLNVRGL